MQAERFRQVRNLFDAALERAPDSRQAFLQEACTGDEELLREVGRLLAAHGEPTGWIDSGLAGAPPRLEGRRFGPYEVLRQLGEGGMGNVYLAARADGVYRKQVALKIVRGAVAAGPEMMQRFQREREILALLDHPNIARIIDGGATEDGLQYLVMDYVEGEPIDVYCDRHRLDIPARVKLFREVCAAVQYAHEHQVVHRDLKPSNILVTRDGVVKLLDFGIAKLGAAEPSATVLTRTDMCLMTPEFASPEQVSGGPVTPATDVYALGVVLYELLTGRKPYRMRNRIIHEVVRVIREEAPTRPSTMVTQADGEEAKAELEAISRARAASIEDLKQQLRGDLDSILLKALNKDSVDRYATAGSLSQDLRRHLEGAEVAAREGEFARNLADWGRRSVWVVLALAAMGLAVYKRALPLAPVVVYGVLVLFVLSVYAAARRIFGKAFMKARMPGLAKRAIAFSLIWIGGLSLLPERGTSEFVFFLVVGGALYGYWFYRAVRWLGRGRMLGPLRHDLTLARSDWQRPSRAALLRAVGSGFWHLLPLSLGMFWFGWLFIQFGKWRTGSAVVGLGVLLVLYALRGAAPPTKEKALARPSWFGVAFVLLSLVMVTALFADDRGRMVGLKAWQMVSLYLLLIWMLVPLLLSGRNEIREGGLAWSGRLIPWSDVLSYAWTQDTGVVEVLQLRVRRGRVTGDLRLPLLATQRELVDAALKEKVSEWPSDLRPRVAAAGA